MSKTIYILTLLFNAGRSKTANETPYSMGAGAHKQSGLTPETDNAQPLDMFRYARMSLDDFYGGTGDGKYYNRINDENYIGQLDLTLPFFFLLKLLLL
ncbi:MAG: hypothetical protein ACOC1D_04980 [Prolixibacteraceae bacterium]